VGHMRFTRMVNHVIGLSDQTIAFGDADTELLARFVTSLPGGWQYELDIEDCCVLYIWRSGFSFGTVPIIMADRTSDVYHVTLFDPSVPVKVDTTLDTDQDVSECLFDDTMDARQDVFKCLTVGDVIVEVQALVCELMRTEDYSKPIPSSWSSCRYCDSCIVSAVNCTKWNPSAQPRAT
jgi:hypothetical protein